MDRFRILALLLILPSCFALSSIAQEQPNFYAVVIGVSQFAHLPQEDWLQYADADARAFASLITSPRGRGFPAENVFTLTDQEASHDALKKRLGYLLPKIVKKPSDTVYIFVATHGMVEKEAAGETYLLGYDSDREDLYDSALSMKDLQDIVQNRLKSAGRVFLFADACRSGKLGKLQGLFTQQLQDAGKLRGGLVASRPNEFSREGKQFGGGHGVFTYYLLKGLMGEADEDKDNIVTADELIHYLQEKVPAATDKQQHAEKFGDFEGDIPLSYVDKPAPQDFNLSALPRMAGTEIASLQVVRPESVDVRSALERAIREGRLLTPAGNNAWELYQRYAQLPVPESDKEVAKDDLVIAMASEGDKVLYAYRRGDQVIRLDAARYDEGAQLFGRAGQIEPDDTSLQAKAKFFSGRLMVENRRYQEGISLLREAVALDPNAAYPYNALGIAYLEQKRWNEAIENFRRASERAENWIYPLYNLSRAYAEQRRFRDAERELNQAIRIESELNLRYSYLHYNLGILYLFQGDAGKAERAFRSAIKIKPDDAMSYHNLGLILEARGESKDAQDSFEHAAQYDPRLIGPRLKLAEIYRRQHRPDLQERVLREALKANPDRAATLGLLGDLHAAQGRWQDAAADYGQAMTKTNDPKLRHDLDKKLKAAERKK